MQNMRRKTQTYWRESDVWEMARRQWKTGKIGNVERRSETERENNRERERETERLRARDESITFFSSAMFKEYYAKIGTQRQR